MTTNSGKKQQQADTSQQAVASNQQLTASSQEPAASNQQAAASRQRPAASSQQPQANSQQPAASTNIPTNICMDTYIHIQYVSEPSHVEGSSEPAYRADITQTIAHTYDIQKVYT